MNQLSQMSGEDLGALSEVKASQSSDHVELPSIQLTLAQVLAEIRQSNDGLMQKLEKLEEKVTSELQGLGRRPGMQPRLASDQSCGQWSKGRRPSEHSMELSGTSSQLARKLGAPAKEAIEMDIGQMIPAYLGGPSALGSAKKLRTKNRKASTVCLAVQPEPPAPAAPSAPAAPGAPAFEPVVLAPERAERKDANQVSPDHSPRLSFRKPNSDPPVLSFPLTKRISSNSDLVDAPRKVLSNPEESSMVNMVSARSGRFCPSSEKLNQAIYSGNLTEVFRVQERGLMEALSPRNERNDEAEKEFAPVLEALDVETESLSQERRESRWLWLSPLHEFLARYASKALGLMPLFDVQMEAEDTSRSRLRLRARRMVSRLYHWFVLFSLILAAAWLGSRYSSDVNDEDFDCGGLPPLTTDLAIVISACMVLSSWGGFWSYQETTQRVASGSRDLADCCEMIHLDHAWRIWSCTDALMASLLFLGLLGGRVAVTLMTLEEHREGGWGPVLLSMLPFAVSAGILAIASFWQVRTSHAMTLIINEWSGTLVRGQSSAWQLKGAWRLISGLFRKTSRTFQYCYAALCATIVLVAFTAINDARRDLLVPSLPNLAVALLLPGVLVILASTTTACRRLPSLVSLVEPTDAKQETEFMELTLFLSFSECGFFLWDTSVTVGLVQKFLYFTLAVAGTMGFQSGAFRLK